MNGPVVVGVDDLEHSAHAISAAAHEAQIRGVPLWLVHAYQSIPAAAFGASLGDATHAAMRESAQALLDRAAATVQAGHPGLAVRTEALAGAAPQCLAEACPTPSLLVVGGRGRGGFNALMLGSVALRVLSHAHVPVMVVRGEVEAEAVPGHVLVGVDLGVEGRASGPELLEFAFAEAAARKARVHVVHAWPDNRYLYLTVGGEYVTEQFQASVADREKRLDALLAVWQEKYPAVFASRQMFAGSPARVLVESSRLADVVVLGGRLRAEGHEGMRVGALAHTVLHHAHCPVIVVPER